MVRLTHRTRKRVLLAINAVLVMGIVGACVAACLPPRLDTGDDSHVGQGRSAGADGLPPLGSRGDYHVIAARDIRQPLYDRPVAKAAARAPKQFPAKLRGTIIDPAFASALFRTARGEEKLLSVGEEVDGGIILTIEPDAVTVKFDGREVVVQKEPGK